MNREVSAIGALLDAYAASGSAAVSTFGGAAASALSHSSMLDDGDCGCAVCAEWRRRRTECDAAMRVVPEGHQWSICACGACRFAGRMHLNFIAAANVRDLMIEVAFHANWHSRHGEAVMRWFEGELRSPRYTTRWCAYEIGRRPVGEWLALCERALSPVLSGAVFAAGEGRSAMVPWMPASAGAIAAAA